MLYKLVIADDEYRTRVGLKSFIDWHTLGFEVVATFEDGDDLLSYIGEHRDIDVILTDIQMNRVGGIQIAQTVKTYTPAPRVIFISAYEQLDYAFAAIENNVNGYIIKPIDHSKLKALFQSLKTELDDEYQIREIKKHYSAYQKNMNDTKEYFFADLLTSGAATSQTAKFLFHIIYPSLSFDDCFCFEVTLKFTEYKHFMKYIWDATSNDLYTTLQDSIRLFNSECEYWLLSKQNHTLVLCGIYKPSVDTTTVPLDVIKSLINEETKRLSELLTQTYETTITVCSLHIFRSIPTLASALYSRELYAKNNTSTTNVIEDAKEYIRTHIEDDLSLETIADHFYLSQTYFSKLFKNTTGKNLVDFIIYEKMEYVKALLRDTDIKIYKIAEKVGFKSTSHFNKQFRKHTNMTPNEYRDTILEKKQTIDLRATHE